MSDQLHDRSKQLRNKLEAAHERIRNASDGRVVELLVVSKTYPATDVKILSQLGQVRFGENRDQEAREKVLECTDFPLLKWHMIGQLQSNKFKSIARWADMVETLDRVDHIQALDKAASMANRTLGVLIQFNLDPADSPSRGGAHVSQIPEFLQEFDQAPHLLLRGVMGIAPHPSTGMPAGGAFEKLASTSQMIRETHPDAEMISAGMSEDLESAISAGATQVRLGSAILGQRQYVQ